MNRFVSILLLSLSVFLTGCHKPEVKFTDMRPTPTATVSTNTVTVHLGGAYLTSAYWVHAKSKVEGQTVVVYGYYTLKELSHEYVVKLPASVSSQTVAVVWLNPDGSRVPIPFTK
jgi:hypothetical protein